MAGLLEQLNEALGGDAVQQISQKIGADPAQTQSAIATALPMLMGALGQEATDPQRAPGLLAALSSDHDGSILDNLSGYLSGQVSGKAANGQGILDHVLGDRQETAKQALASKSGLDLGSIASLLPILAPIVMSLLGKRAQSGDDIAGQLGSATQQAAESSPDIGDLLGAVLGGGQASGAQGGIGGILGSIFGRR